jgi:broad specificity phosphatase PhoE
MCADENASLSSLTFKGSSLTFRLARGNSDNLTGVGKDQALRLARYLRDRPVRFTRVLSSDLDRATDTARTICQYQLGSGPALEPFQTAKLREQCFGCGRLSREVTQIESMSSMRARVNGFLRDHILPEMANHATGGNAVIAVVGHGVILQVLWACLTEIFGSQSFHLARNAGAPGADYMHPLWSNTGIMEVDIRPGGPPQEMLIRNMIHPNVEPPWLMRAKPPFPPDGSAPLIGWSVTILTVDSTVHLDGEALAQTIPAVVPQSRQQPMDQFYRLTGSV